MTYNLHINENQRQTLIEALTYYLESHSPSSHQDDEAHPSALRDMLIAVPVHQRELGDDCLHDLTA